MDNWFINRGFLTQVEKKLKPNKVVLLLGARRVGKTKFIQHFLKQYQQEEYIKLNGEDVSDAELLQLRTVQNYKRLLKNVKLLVIDEAQHIEHIGKILKLIVDEIEGIRILVTGSSMFDLNNQLGEPLVGRKHTIHVYPFSQLEFSKQEQIKTTKEKLEERLIYGSYPELIHIQDWREKEDYLYEIVNDYLLKDILMYQTIKKSNKIYDLLRLIAFQVGSEVSLHELGKQLQMSKNTVESYLDLLCKVFVLFKIEGFSRNLRKEITKSSKWYFYDNGIRNALIRNFKPLHLRNDIGQLWENYLIYERIKKQAYTKQVVTNHFWRTYDQQELDWLEEQDSQLRAFEFKWSNSKKSKIPRAFAKAYENATFEVITKDNYLDFID